MTALAACGRRYEALAAFDRLRESLTREFAADPEPATRRLYRDLLTGGDQSPDAAMAAGPATASPAALALSRTAATTALERRCGDQAAAVRCLVDARRGFLALADESGLAYLDSHAEPPLSGR